MKGFLFYRDMIEDVSTNLFNNHTTMNLDKHFQTANNNKKNYGELYNFDCTDVYDGTDWINSTINRISIATSCPNIELIIEHD